MADASDSVAAPVKRYVVFSGGNYYPAGGWEDLIGSYDTLGEVRSVVADLYKRDWYHIVDLTTGHEIKLSELTATA